MGAPCTALLAVLPTTTITTSFLDNIPQETVRKVHIVYMGESLQDEDQATASHRSLLEQATLADRDEKENGLVYSYKRSFNGFSAYLTVEEAQYLSAYSMNATRSPHMELGYGSGHVNPVSALNPGLVYDAYEWDYVEALCHLGYNETRLRLITGDATSCGSLPGGGASVPADGIVWGLNYPSISLSVKKLPPPVRATFPRTVTNVGAPNSTYRVTIHYPRPDNNTIHITVKPSVLLFTGVGQKRSFVVEVFASDVAEDRVISASMVWSDGSHRVVSPIVMHNITL